MEIAHIATWCLDLEKMVDFYCRYFGCRAGSLYHNPANEFRSCFLEFPGQGSCRIELMHRASLKASMVADQSGLAHIAISAGNEPEVIRLTERLRKDGYRVIGEPRRTGDGYFESIVLDPEGNRIEITS